MPTYVKPSHLLGLFFNNSYYSYYNRFFNHSIILKLKDDSKAALKSLVAVVGVALLIIVSFFLGSSELYKLQAMKELIIVGFGRNLQTCVYFQCIALVTIAFLSIFAVGLI
jgi:hypothetical protein